MRGGHLAILRSGFGSTKENEVAAGDIVLAATGVYLAGDFVYQHWTSFRDVADDVGHATVKVADNAWHSVTSAVGSWF
jgi:hypothetical protein